MLSNSLHLGIKVAENSRRYRRIRHGWAGSVRGTGVARQAVSSLMIMAEKRKMIILFTGFHLNNYLALIS
jgi:hypothetical protein